jgi:predicted Ser/Thr protein kinase
MPHDSPSAGPRPGSSVVPTPPVLAPRTESERRRLAEIAPATDNAPTVISAKRLANGLTPPARAEDDLRGRRLGHFELAESLGVGGMAAVLKATDLTLGRIVALKILPPEATADPEHVTRFQSEARAAAKLDHENVARVYFCGEDQGVYFIAFEFVEGVNLRTLIERRGRLPVGEAVHTILQVATGLAHAAARGVVHRDVKPSNIIVTPAGRAKIVDMGLARHQDGPADGLTQSGVTLGTFDYISPEQALEPRAADVRSDIYSLGCTFYHTLTGCAPVPEGTAAKKLHAHQHVPPTDPRQYNPEIPESVVAVLGRMMAKDPRDRYQRPEELVHDLLGLARRMPAPGSPTPATEAEGGGLWVDAPLPAPVPRRTAFVAVASVLAVAAIVAVIEAGRPSPPAGGSGIARLAAPPVEPAIPGSQNPVADNTLPVVPPVADVPGSQKPARTAPTVQRAADVDQLRDLLKQDVRELHIVLTGAEPYVLNDAESDTDSAGLVFAGKKLVLESSDPSTLAVIRFKAAPTGDGKPAAALTISAKNGEPGATAPGGSGVSVTLRGLRFECEGTAEAPAAAVLAADLDKLDVERCAFDLPDQPVGARPAGAIVVQGRDGPDRPTVTLKACLFVRGAQAVQLLGRASVYAQHCCFGPHNAVIHLRDTGGPDENGAGTLVRLEHCSALLENGAVIWAEDGAGGTVQVGHCLFTRAPHPGPPPQMGREDDAGAVLVRQTGAAAGPLAYQGLLGLDGHAQRNAYQNLTAIWSDETSPTRPRRAPTLEDARGLSFAMRDDDRRRAPAFQDDDGLEMAQSPWADSDPLAKLADSPQEAFAVNLLLARVRAVSPPSVTGGKMILGALHNIWGQSYQTPSPPSDEPPIVRAKIVNPAVARMDAERGIYPTLAHAILDAKPGDTILIQKTGPLEIEPLRLEKPDMRLTIQAFPRYRPVLTLAPAAEPDAALFRLLDGELRFDGLEFALRPGRTEYKSQAVVAIAGGGSCTFHDCAITLEEIESVTLAGVSLPDTNSAPSMTGGKMPPRVRFENCFIRGKGDLLAARGGRRFELDLDGTLAGLDGSLVVATGAARDPVMGGPAQVRLRRSTAVLTEHVLDLRAARDDEGRHGAGPPPVAVACEDTLLAAAAGRGLVRVDGVDADEQVRQLVGWTGKQTVYANTGSAILEIVPTNPERMPLPMPFDAEKWLAFTRTTDMTAFARVKFANLPGPDKPWPRSRAADFRPKVTDMGRPADAVADVGAPLDGLPAAGGE